MCDTTPRNSSKLSLLINLRGNMDLSVGRFTCGFGIKGRHGFAIRKLARQIRTTLCGRLRDQRRGCLIGDCVRRRGICNRRILSITLGTILLLRCIRHLWRTIGKAMMTRRAPTQPVLLHRLFLAFVEGCCTGVKGNSGGEFSFETITAAFANGPAEEDENDDKNDETDEGKNTAL